MLVLSRKRDEVIHIGDGITVRVLAIHGNVVRLGIIAPKEVAVVRGEIINQPRKDKTNGY